MKVYRSAVTGQFVTPAEAAADPERHIEQTVENRPSGDRAGTAFPARFEALSDHFHKWHLEGLDLVIHRFTRADGPGADFHDHPWPFDIQILHGGYREEVLSPDGQITVFERRAGDVFRNEASTTHRITHMEEGGCLTLFHYAGPTERPTVTFTPHPPLPSPP